MSRIPQAPSEVLRTSQATADLFDVLGMTPELGRRFVSSDEEPGAEPVAMISHGLWRRVFNADPTIVGTSVSFGRVSRRIVGVTPLSFDYPIGQGSPTDVWIPLVMRPQDLDHSTRGRSFLIHVVGRLEDRMTLEQVRAEFSAIRDRVAAQFPFAQWEDYRVSVVPLKEHVVGPIRQWMVIVLGAALLVLATAAANCAVVLSITGTGRRHEMAVRFALGASPSRQFMTVIGDSVALAGMGGAAALALTWWTLDFVRATLPAGIARAADIQMNARVFGGGVAAAALLAIICGVGPAWQAVRARSGRLLVDRNARPAAGIASTLRSGMLTAQIAAVAMLVVANIFFMLSLARVTAVDLGFEPHQLVAFGMTRPPSASGEADSDTIRRNTAAAFQRLTREVTAVPGVVAAAVYDGPLPLMGGGVSYSIGGLPSISGELVEVRAIAPEYLSTAGMRVVMGRALLRSDDEGSPRVALVSHAAARRFFADRDPIGAVLDFRGPFQIVGIVNDVRDRGPENESRPVVYFPIAQHPVPTGFATPMMVARLASPSADVVANIQATLNGGVRGVAQVGTAFWYEHGLRRLTAQRRFVAGLVTVFGGIAVCSGAFGIYVAVRQFVLRRRKRIGIALALGSPAKRVFVTILASASLHLISGLVLGLALSRILAAGFADVLFDVRFDDSEPYFLAAVFLIATGFIAVARPALAATKLDPLQVIRDDSLESS